MTSSNNALTRASISSSFKFSILGKFCSASSLSSFKSRVASTKKFRLSGFTITLSFAKLLTTLISTGKFSSSINSISSRFSISLVGGIDNNEELKNVLNKNFGELNSIKETESIKSTVPQNKIKDKTKRIQIKHQFFTDISADKAGPRPAVLIPTTDFSDPLLYIIGTPEISSTDCALFNALLYRLEEKLQEKVSSEQKVIVKAPTSDLPFAQIIVTKIKHINQTDSLYKNVISDLIEELKLIIDNKLEFVKDLEKNYVLNELENKWVLKELTKTNNLIGTSELIHNGIIHNNPTLYIDMYKAITNATAEDYYIIAKSFFEDAQTLRLYSADSKK